jgi:hypothetical protein
MSALNNSIWATGLLLQCLLLAALVVRGVWRRLPLFTILIGFYLVRSVFLFASFGFLDQAAYSLASQALSLTDLVLQTMVAWELFSGGRQYPPNDGATVPVSLRRRLAIFFALLAGSAVAVWGVTAAIHINPANGLDRGVLLPFTLMLAVAAVTYFRGWISRSPAGQRVLVGFTALAVSGIAAQIGRAIAAQYRNASAYRGWSYEAAVAYLVILLFWLLALARATPPGEKMGQNKPLAVTSLADPG